MISVGIKTVKTRGHGKAEFKENLALIQKALFEGRSARSIWIELSSNKKVSVGLRVFQRYVKKFKKPVQHSTLPDVVSFSPHPHSVSVPLSVEKPSAIFTPEPIDLEDEFGDDSESEVSHG